MGCIMIDPPLAPNRGWALPYMTISLDELQKLPIRDLPAPDRCHLHVWTLPSEYMFALKPIIEDWGFRLVSSFAWVKPAALGRGNYWRMSHEILLTAVLANRNDRFDDQSLRSWIEAPRGRHSEKPDAVRGMIERASPGPRLELSPANSCRVGSRGDTRSPSHWSIKLRLDPLFMRIDQTRYGSIEFRRREMAFQLAWPLSTPTANVVAPLCTKFEWSRVGTLQ